MCAVVVGCHLANRLAVRENEIISLITLRISTNYTTIYRGHGAKNAAIGHCRPGLTNEIERTKSNRRFESNERNRTDDLNRTNEIEQTNEGGHVLVKTCTISHDRKGLLGHVPSVAFPVASYALLCLYAPSCALLSPCAHLSPHVCPRVPCCASLPSPICRPHPSPSCPLTYLPVPSRVPLSPPASSRLFTALTLCSSSTGDHRIESRLIHPPLLRDLHVRRVPLPELGLRPRLGHRRLLHARHPRNGHLQTGEHARKSEACK